jgi:hypothetical protein
MQSKDGGFTHVYSVGEEDQLRAHGWVPEVISVTGSEAVKPKRGRKPKAEDVSVATEDVDEVSDVTEAEAEDGADNVQ